MAKYEWNSSKLRRQCRTYNWVALVSMILALVGVLVFPNLNYIVLIFAGIAFILVILGYQAQKKDRKLKKDEKENT